jgi:hypothetical protein
MSTIKGSPVPSLAKRTTVDGQREPTTQGVVDTLRIEAADERVEFGVEVHVQSAYHWGAGAEMLMELVRIKLVRAR